MKRRRFGWACLLADEQPQTGNDIRVLADSIAGALGEPRKIALGFECPLWVPVDADPQQLTAARSVDGNKPWSAGAGAAALATGLSECAWIPAEVRRRMIEETNTLSRAYLDWRAFESADSGLFLWEAFVTGRAKAVGMDDGESHAADALIARREFVRRVPHLAESIPAESWSRTRSLIGGALLWAGWSMDLSVLNAPCVVIRPGISG